MIDPKWTEQIVDVWDIWMDSSFDWRYGRAVDILKGAVAAASYEKGSIQLAPVKVVHDKVNLCYWLCDGFRRMDACRLLGFQSVKCLVAEGDHSLAAWVAYGTNVREGTRLSAFELRRRARSLMADWRFIDIPLEEKSVHCGLPMTAMSQILRGRIKGSWVGVKTRGLNQLIAIRDGMGRTVDDLKVMDAIQRRKEIFKMANYIGMVMKRVSLTLASGDNILGFLDEKVFMESASNAKRALLHSVPFGSCLVCRAKGEIDGKRCMACRGHGWVNKAQYEANEGMA